MIFELDHTSINTALREYMDRRNIATGKDFTFVMKTSRKGTKTSRAVITTVDVPVNAVEAIVEPTVAQDVVAPTYAEEAQPAAIVQLVQPVEVVPTVEEKIEEVKSTPFKKLFA